jgi:hypothetical protein
LEITKKDKNYFPNSNFKEIFLVTYEDNKTDNRLFVYGGTRDGHEKRRFCDFSGQISGILHIVGANNLI